MFVKTAVALSALLSAASASPVTRRLSSDGSSSTAACFPQLEEGVMSPIWSSRNHSFTWQAIIDTNGTATGALEPEIGIPEPPFTIVPGDSGMVQIRRTFSPDECVSGNIDGPAAGTIGFTSCSNADASWYIICTSCTSLSGSNCHFTPSHHLGIARVCVSNLRSPTDPDLEEEEEHGRGGTLFLAPCARIDQPVAESQQAFSFGYRTLPVLVEGEEGGEGEQGEEGEEESGGDVEAGGEAEERGTAATA
ncbi:hypothetical protein JCM8097_002357 [Rhodosporidiobolus ruineniae]